MDKKNISDPKNDPGKIPPYAFCLYITGASPNSVRAITNINELLETHIPGKYEIKVIDVYQQPLIPGRIDIIALPLLIRKRPLPEKRMIGDLSDKEKILSFMQILNNEEKEE